ncbi:unnamed protein product [Penicillium glandicola]
MIRPAPYHLLILGALGITSIWGLIGYGGKMFDNFDAIVASGHLPDGRIMRMTYTGIKALDRQMTPVIAFYEVLSNSQSAGPRALFFDINFVVACSNIWVLIESRRRGVTSYALKYKQLRDPTIPKNEAMAIFAMTIATLLCPSLLFVPPLLQASDWSHHGYIALFHATPLLITFFFVINSRFLESAAGHFLAGLLFSSKKDTDPTRHPEKSWLVASYVLAGTVAGAVHLFTVLAALKALNADATFIQVFVPTWKRLAAANTLPLSWTGHGGNSTGTIGFAYPLGVDKSTEILEQFHLFSQFDWLVVSMSCVVFVHILLSMARGSKVGLDLALSRIKGGMSAMEKTDLILLLLGAMVLGPGAAGSFGLAVRESRLRQQFNRARKLH